MTFGCVIDLHIDYLFKHNGTNVVVVFDDYSGNSKNTKVMMQLSRIRINSAEIVFKETPKPSNQERFISKKCIKLLYLPANDLIKNV